MGSHLLSVSEKGSSCNQSAPISINIGITKEEIEQHQKSLEDLESSCEKINIEKEEVPSLN